MGAYEVWAYGERVLTISAEIVKDSYLSVALSLLRASTEPVPSKRDMMCAALGLPGGIASGAWEWVRAPSGLRDLAYMATEFDGLRGTGLSGPTHIARLETVAIGGVPRFHLAFAPLAQKVFWSPLPTKDGCEPW